MNKCGVTEWYLPVSGPSAIKLCKKLGLDGIQIGDLGGYKANFPMLDERIKDMYKEELDDGEFEIYSYHAVDISRDIGFKSELNSEMGRLSLEIVKKSIQICREYNIPNLMLGCFTKAQPGNKYEIKLMTGNLKEFNRIAAANGVQLALESFIDFDSTLVLLDEVQGLKLCYDLLNPIKFGFGEPRDDLKKVRAEQIDHIHVKDAPENMVDFLPVGDGAAYIRESVNRLKDVGFEGWYFLENHYNEPSLSRMGCGLDPLAEDIRRIKSMW